MIFEDEDGLRFDLGTESRFYFKCQRCRACCNNKRIVPSPAEAARLAGFLGLADADFRRDCLDPADGTLRVTPDGDCLFLGPEGCRAHPARPLVCRLFPLGLIRGEDGRVRYGLMPLHPDCVGYLSGEGTIAEYLEKEGAPPRPETEEP